MTDLAYISFVMAMSVFGALLGIFAHFWRAHATRFPEDLGLGEPLNMLTRDNYAVEKYVVETEWNDAGYWDGESVRNVIYYIVGGAIAPLIFGFALWEDRFQLVAAVCQGLTSLGLQPPLCP
ncbi:MAG: hypothetical protein JNJ53_07970 [Rhizobiales bacterium]|nr:hypothetical protein [Hyphomicrobiales bacterium]